MSLTVETTSGRIEGVDNLTHRVFRGIPYAAPPVGARRFESPATVEPWAGVRPCMAPGPACPQPPSPLPGMAPGPQSEDCLNLNVFTPSCDDAARPVLFWIHGGAFRTGSNGQAMYEGRGLVERGDVVLVTINYRLGPLGYLHLEGGPHNVGQQDQIKALEWVRDNIAAFGGDPRNVTVFGESAGAMATTTLLAMPHARGLFHRAIAQSGAAQGTLSAEEAERVAFEVARNLGSNTAERDSFRGVAVEDLVAASVKAHDKLARDLFLPFAPTLEDETLPVEPLEAIRNGAARDIPLIVGTTRDEWRLFTFAIRSHRSLEPATLQRRIRSRLEKIGVQEADAATRRLLDVYGIADRAPWKVFDAIETDRNFRLPALELAIAQGEHNPNTFAYLFAWPSPAARGALGACHAVELPFVFGTLDAPTMDRFAGQGADADALSSKTMDAWLSFARSGTPGLPGLLPNGAKWARYDARRRETLVLDRECRLESDPQSAERSVWEEIL